MPVPTPAPETLLPSSTQGRSVVAKFLRALGDPTRLALVEFLMQGERTGNECVEQAGLSQGRVSAHLACLVDCGYASARREGRFVYYQVTDPRVAELITLARSLAADNAAALVACTRIAPPGKGSVR